jgi:hypothetical protein
LKFPLTLTYNNVAAIDGFGAQAIRIMGVYAISKSLLLSYEHAGIKDVPRTELSREEVSDEQYLEYLELFNRLLAFESSTSISKNQEFVFKENIWPSSLIRILLTSFNKKQGLILSLSKPQGITDRFPSILKIAAKQVRKNLDLIHPEKTSKKTTVVLHIRAEHQGPNKLRKHLSPDYYMKVLEMQEISRFRHNNAKLVIHTDFFPEDFDFPESSWRIKIFSDFFNKVRKEWDDIEFHHYADLERAILDMVRADILIMSRSSLSYFAALINENSVIYPPHHGHSPLKNWILGPSSVQYPLFNDEGFAPSI